MLNTNTDKEEEKSEQSESETAKENEEPDNAMSFADLLVLIKTFLDSKGFNAIVDKFPTKVEKLKIDSENKEKDFKYLKRRYLFDILTVSIILAFITILSNWGLIEKATLGTLLGSIIGYALGRFKNRND